MTELATGMTTLDGQPPHAHAFELDEYRNGETKGQIGSGQAPHTHAIVGGKVQASGWDNHTHELATR